MTNQNDSAFPIKDEQVGLTKRELFAKDILCALLVGRDSHEFDYGIKYAVEITDKFINELNKQEDE